MIIAEVISRVREFLKGLSPTEIKKLSREEFVEVLGIDPKQIPLKDRMEIARMLYNEFRHVISYKWLSEKLSMSLRDVQKAIKGEDVEGREVEALAKLSPDVVVKAIKLLREGRVRNPNDLVLELGVSLDEAEELYKRITRNEETVALPVIEAIERFEKLLKQYRKDLEKFEDIAEIIKKFQPETIKKQLDEVLEQHRKIVEEYKQKTWIEVDKLLDLVQAIRTYLTALGSEAKIVLELLKKVEDPKERVEKLEK
uniref:Uncharacterized protein n=1 Tax=Ignisphaera aggregans TaxID=334771 RepID=A0A7J3Z7Q8_9CREN